MKIIYYFSILSAVFLVTEAALRTVALDHLPIHWQYKIKEKQVHCYDSQVSAIRLCPNVNQNLCHPLGYCFQLTTNSRGERIGKESETPLSDLLDSQKSDSNGIDSPNLASENHTSNNRNTVIWAIGDSLTMGFGINDQDSFPYLLSESGFQVRNIASDSLGAMAIHRILEYNLSILSNPNKFKEDEITSYDKKPDYLVWVFSRSDFLDDLTDSSWKSKIVFYLGKLSAWINVFRAEMEQYKLARDANDYKEFIAEKYLPPSPDHPTLLAIDRIKDLSDRHNIKPIILLAPDWNPSLNEPVPETEYFQFVRKTFLDREFTVIDLSNEYQSNKNRILWLENDGHPNASAHQIFKEAVIKKIN